MLQEAQSGRTRGSLAVLAPVTHEAAQWDGSYWRVGVKQMTWCVTETHHLSVIQVFELQGCNVARLVWKDLFQIAGPEGSAAVHVGGLSGEKNVLLGEEVVDIMRQKKRLVCVCVTIRSDQQWWKKY